MTFAPSPPRRWRRSLLVASLGLAVVIPSAVDPSPTAARDRAAPAPSSALPQLPLPDPLRLLAEISALPRADARKVDEPVRRPAAEPADTARERRHRHTPDRLPLGPKGLPEKRTERRLAEGVTLTVIRRGGNPVRKGKIGSSRRGPWVVRALTIDPEVARGKLATTFGPALAEVRRTTRLTRRVDALAGVNASFFAIGTHHPGDPVGLTIAGGQVLSEPSGYDSEVTLLVDSQQNKLRMGSLSWSGLLRNDVTDATRRLDVVNSAPRVPNGCATAAAQRTCTRPGQIASFTSDFARKTPQGVGFEVVLDGDGCVVRSQHKRGVRLTRDQKSLQATGSAVRELQRLAADGCLSTKHQVRNREGDRVRLRDSTSAVTGRYRLLNNGRIVAPKGPKPFFDRHPRTIAGTTRDGKIVLVTIDGRQRRSVGATLREAAKVARALGMRDAVNLDGGGSTTMSVRGRLTNNVPGAERAVSDALVWLRDKRGKR